MYHTTSKLLLKSILLLLAVISFTGSGLMFSCNNKKEPAAKEIVNTPEKMNEKVREIISASLQYASASHGKVDDSVVLSFPAVTDSFYKSRSNDAAWCSEQKWLPVGDSLLDLIAGAKLYGLFPEDYHFHHLNSIRNRFANDSLQRNDRKDAALWARADIMLTDALIRIIKDIRLGRLPGDSITLRKDSVLSPGFYIEKIGNAIKNNSLHNVIAGLEPVHRGYHELKAGIPDFLAKADFRDITPILYPNKNYKELRKEVVRRLFETGFLDSASAEPDSAKLITVLKNFQQEKYLTADGRIGAQTVRELNTSDKDKFFRIAITLDRYKMLPERMPGQYVWVNIPSYSLRLISNDSVRITSRVVVGKPKTRTPVLTSSLHEMITYPQWNIPQSIIVKEILPGLKKNPGYLAKKGYSLLTNKGEEVDPDSVNWSKYTKGIPYRVIQGSGDANALGVLKFNFFNKYSVYLHDTNQRSFFGLDSRAFSHGCVRVQEWEKIAFYILRNEREYAAGNKFKYAVSEDSVRHWLSNKEKHVIPLKNRLAVFIRYFTCEGRDGKISFYEDVYDEDRQLMEKIFLNKKKGA